MLRRVCVQAPVVRRCLATLSSKTFTSTTLTPCERKQNQNQSVARNGNNTAAWVRDYRATVFAASSVTIGVPNMGDSITEGEIAAIIKAPGDAVAEDEVVVQVETDKVTIDIRSPGSGVVEEIMVAESDTVVVGQAVAKVSLGATAEASGAATTAAAVEETPQVVEEVVVEAASVASASDAADHDARVPLIHFPKRRTEAGECISMLSAEDRAKLGLSGGAAVAEPQFKGLIITASNPTSDPSWRNYKPNYDDHLRRRAISEREIESIMLGGATD